MKTVLLTIWNDKMSDYPVLDYTFKGDCDEFIKKDFLKIRKQGLKL